MDKIQKKDLTANILFSGVGFQERGFENSGLYNLKVLNTSEINKEAILTYAAIHCGLTPKLVEEYKDYPSIDDMIKELEEKNIGYIPPSNENQKGKIYNWKKYKKNRPEVIKKYWLAVHLSNNKGDISKIKSLPYADLWTVSFPCFPAGTLVLTNRGYKKIEDIVEGEKVLTHKKRYRKVIQTMNKLSNNISFVKTVLSDPISCTPNHPFYACKIENNELTEPQWVEAKDLTSDYYVGCPIEVKGYERNFEILPSSEFVLYTKEEMFNKTYRLMSANKKGYKPTYITDSKIENIKKFQLLQLPNSECFVKDGFIWGNVKQVVNKSMEKRVYNLEVEEDNSYVVQNITVHNCQSISVAGKMKGFSPDSGTRSSLLWENIRLLKDAYEKKEAPKYIMFENVKNLVSKSFINDFEILLDVLNDLGYNSYWDILNAATCGIPQNRERVFVVSIRKDIDDGLFTFPIPFDNGIRLKDVLQKNVDEKYYLNSKRSNDLINKLIMDGKLESGAEGNL